MTSVGRPWARLVLSVYGAVALGAGGWMVPWVMVAAEGVAAGFLVAGLRGTIRRAPPIVLAAAGPLLARAVDAPTLGSVAAVFAVLWSLRGSESGRSSAAAVAVIAALRLAFTTAAGWHCENGLAAGQSWAASVLAGRCIELGPTYAASRVVILETLLLLCSAPRRSLSWTGLMLAGPIAAPIAVGLAAGWLDAFGSGASDRGARLVATQLPWAAVVIVCGCAAAASRFSDVRQLRARVVLAVALIVTGGAAALPNTTRPDTATVLLYEPGFQNWLVPTEKEFGRYSAGMLGTLPRFIEALGASPRSSRDLAAAELASADAVVLVNQDAPLPSGAAERVEAFVREGGLLVVVADHTFLHEPRDGGQPMLFANEPLCFTHMRFANDSADPLVSGFSASIRSCRLGGSLRPGPGNPSGASIGGAVHAAWPAWPLLVAPHAYRDIGLPARDAQRGFLGDLVWNGGERLGDIVLAAEEDVGRGSVLVVGDTTGVTNLGRPFHWEWWGKSLRPAAHAPGKAHVFALVASAILLISGRFRTSIVAFALAVTVDSDGEPRPLTGAAPLLVVDEAVCPEGRAGDWEGDGSLSLLVTAYRAGYVPCVGDVREGELLDGAAALVVAGPRADPGYAWTERVLGWVGAGGRLFVGASHPDSRHIAGLLARLGAQVSSRVLGPQRVHLADGIVTLREPWALDVGACWKPVVLADRDVLVAAREVGLGEVILVGDSRFFRNETLECEERVDEDNVRYLTRILRPGSGQ